jgi:hypothetical protein
MAFLYIDDHDIRFNTFLQELEYNSGNQVWLPIPTSPSTITLLNGQTFIGNASNLAMGVTLSGAATVSNTGVLTLATVNANVGSFTNTNLTVNAQGLITAASNGTAGVTPSVVTSSTTVGGAATEAVTVAGLLTTSTIWAVTQITKGGSNLPLLSWTNTTNGHLNIIYSADMGSGAIVRVIFVA